VVVVVAMAAAVAAVVVVVLVVAAVLVVVVVAAVAVTAELTTVALARSRLALTAGPLLFWSLHWRSSCRSREVSSH